MITKEKFKEVFDNPDLSERLARKLIIQQIIGLTEEVESLRTSLTQRHTETVTEAKEVALSLVKKDVSVLNKKGNKNGS